MVFHPSIDGLLAAVKGTVHQMYECVSDVLLHLEKMSGIVFTVQTAQIWQKNGKKHFDQNVLLRPFRSAPASFEECPLI